MNSYSFRLACDDDDPALRDLLRKTVMRGNINIAFHREPNFFWAERLGNIQTQVILAQSFSPNEIVGCGSRGIRSAYVDGVLKNIGYLGGLRIVPKAQGGTVLARGYRYLRELHNDGQVPYYYTTILSENKQARDILTSGRGGLPIYTPRGTLLTGLIPLSNRSFKEGSKAVTRASEVELDNTLNAVNRYNRRWQFAPHYRHCDFSTGFGRMRGFSLENTYLYKNQDSIHGTISVWDQTNFKQVIVDSYAGVVKWTRPIYNICARQRSLPGLPAPGFPVRTLYGSLLSVEDDSTEIFCELLNAVGRDWSMIGYDYLAVGLHEGHPLVPSLRKYAARILESELYLVYWPESFDEHTLPQHLTPHIEIATL